MKVSREREQKQAESQEQKGYEIARFVILNIWNSAGKSLKKGRELKTVLDVCEFTWERISRLKNREKEPQSIEDQKRILSSIFKRVKTKARKT